MRIDPNEARRRLSSSRNIANLAGLRDVSTPTPEVEAPVHQPEPPATNVQHEDIKRGRQLGSHTVPEPLRDIMAQSVHDGATAASVARAFGVSADVAERAASGRVGGKPANATRAEQVKMRRLDIQDQALKRLMLSLNLLDEEKLADCSAKELANVAGQMAKVSKDVDMSESVQSPTQILVYAPQLKDESRFKVVDV